ncbi:hypothetical protein [Paenibacillus sp. A14]|uniref:hypothetical protein n=1 Tax=Paenibacillus sp. A14 TaxID=3119820 RepID=UPI002FE35212
MYTQQDPIGLAGNNPTLYGYVYDPNTEVDVFGLSKNGCIPGGKGEAGSRTFYTVQNSIDETRLLKGGEPWPTAPHKAHLGEGVYAWDNKVSALDYLDLKLKRNPSADLKIIEFSVAKSDLAKFKSFDVDGLSSEETALIVG